MPLYEYYCDKCDCCVERLEKRGTPPPECPTNRNRNEPCGLIRLMSKSAFRLKGNEWHKDNKQKRENSKS